MTDISSKLKSVANVAGMAAEQNKKSVWNATRGTCRSLTNVAAIAVVEGRRDEALAMYRRAYNLSLETVGLCNMLTSTAAWNLSLFLLDSRKDDEAVAVLETLVDPTVSLPDNVNRRDVQEKVRKLRQNQEDRIQRKAEEEAREKEAQANRKQAAARAKEAERKLRRKMIAEAGDDEEAIAKAMAIGGGHADEGPETDPWWEPPGP